MKIKLLENSNRLLGSYWLVLGAILLNSLSLRAQEDPFNADDFNFTDIEVTSPSGDVLTGVLTSPKLVTEGAKPLIVLIHGGAFTMTPNWPTDVIQSTNPMRQYFCSGDYIIFQPVYRLVHPYVTECTDLAWWFAVQDVNAMIKKAVDIKAQNPGNPNFNFDPNRVILMGFSAGAITALTLTFTSEAEMDAMPPSTTWGGLNASCEPGTESHSYTIQGTVSACGALPNFHIAPDYDFDEKTPIYFLHGIKDMAAPDAEDYPEFCNNPPSMKLYGPAHLLADGSYHTNTYYNNFPPIKTMPIVSPYNPPHSAHIKPTNVYHHRYYLKNVDGPLFNRDHNSICDPNPLVPNSTLIHHVMEGPVTSFTNIDNITSNPASTITVTPEPVTDWVDAVVNSLYSSNNIK